MRQYGALAAYRDVWLLVANEACGISYAGTVLGQRRGGAGQSGSLAAIGIGPSFVCRMLNNSVCGEMPWQSAHF